MLMIYFLMWTTTSFYVLMFHQSGYSTFLLCFIIVRLHTGEEVLGAEEADAEPQDGQFVQAGDDVLREGQQAGEAVQLRVQTVAVAFGWVGLGAFGWGRFDSGCE